MTAFAYQKWEATGNDFVVVELAKEQLKSEQFEAELVRQVCDREVGVGADGVVLLEPGDTPQVEIWNSDGSRAEMCGNALRCVCLILPRSERAVELSISGRPVKAHSRAPGQATISMGPAGGVGERPVFDSVTEFDELLGGRGYLVSFGNPHYVLPCPQIPEDWQQLGKQLQPLADRLLGTGGINCGFMETDSLNGVRRLCVYERGVGFTKSCGSGACAASAVLEGPLGEAPLHRFRLPGGVLEIDREGDDFLLSGPARQEFLGRWPK